MPEPAPELIVLLHGLGGGRLAMQPLRYRLRKRGFRIESWCYRSLRASIDQHASRFYDHLTHDLQHEPRIHIVAHSMGSIVARAAIARGPAANLGRVVLLAPPNHGSPIARYAAKLVGRFCKPIADLSDDSQSLVNRLPSITGLDVGVLAAKYDTLVPVESTHLCGEREHIVLHATHNSLLLSTGVASLVGTFITEGRFKTGEEQP